MFAEWVRWFACRLFISHTYACTKRSSIPAGSLSCRSWSGISSARSPFTECAERHAQARACYCEGHVSEDKIGQQTGNRSARFARACCIIVFCIDKVLYWQHSNLEVGGASLFLNQMCLAFQWTEEKLHHYKAWRLSGTMCGTACPYILLPPVTPQIQC